MRYIAAAFIIMGAAMALPVQAGETPAYKASQENGVTVYRGTHPAINFEILAARQKAQETMRETAALQRKISQQKRDLAAQSRRIEALEQQALRPAVQKPKRRSRYGRSYYGNNRFFGPNGFAGNRFYSGASPQLPVRAPRHHKDKKHQAGE